MSKSWIPSCRRHLFHAILFVPKDTVKWIKTFPVPEDTPDLRFSIEIDDKFPEEFFEYNPWLTGVKRLAFGGIGVFRCRRYLSFRFLQSVTCLTIRADETTAPTQTRAVMGQLPNLDELSLIILGARYRGGQEDVSWD